MNNHRPLTLVEAKAARIPDGWGRRFPGKTLGECIAAGDRGLMYIDWLADLNAINGPQSREERVILHNAAKLLAKEYENEISAAMERYGAGRKKT